MASHRSGSSTWVADSDANLLSGEVLAKKVGQHSWAVYAGGIPSPLGLVEETSGEYRATDLDGDCAYTFVSLRAALSYMSEYAYVVRLFLD